MAPDYDRMKAKLEEFVDATEPVKEPSTPGVALPATYRPACGYDEALRLFEGIKPLLDAEYPEWSSENPPSKSHRYQRQRQAVKKLIARIDSSAEAREILGDGDMSPTISAASMHPVVWDAAKAQWDLDNHAEAVDAVARALNSMLQKRLGRKDLSESGLIRQAFSDSDPQPGKPRLRYPDIESDDTRDSVRRGVMNFGAGCFEAMRNPLAHLPDDEIDLSEQEALESLAAFSWLARQIDAATIEEADE